jgi:hypothetical protein
MRMLAGLGALAAVCGVFVLSPPHPAGGAAAARCPVTTRGSLKKPPAAFVRSGLPVPYVRTWLGSKAIWLRLPRHGILPAQRDPSEYAMSAKFPWWRVLGGQLHAWAHPVGQARPRLKADGRLRPEGIRSLLLLALLEPGLLEDHRIASRSHHLIRDARHSSRTVEPSERPVACASVPV